MIKLSGVSKKFEQRGIAGLHDLSLEVPQGKIVAVLGPNGSGKTTLLNVVQKKISPDSGEVSVEGRVHSFRTQELPIDENVQKYLMRQVTRNVDDEKKIQLTRDLADIFEFTFQLKQKTHDLSQGQRQKVLLAAELMDSPDVLLLDEPFAHLDPFSRADILKLLFHYVKNREMTMIWVTHDLNEAMRHSDEMVLLHFGKIEQKGTAREFMTHPKNLFVAQFMGHKNFIPIESQGRTPWGVFPGALHHQGYLIVPTFAWKLDSNSPFEIKIETVHFKDQFLEIEATRGEKQYVVDLPLSKINLIETQKTLSLTPDWDECLLIPL